MTPARLLLAAALTMAPLAIAQETPPAPAPDTQPDQPKEQPKPDPTKPDQGPVKPTPAPTVPPSAPAPAPPAAPETPAEVPQGRQFFLAAADVIKKAQAITYRAKSYGEGQMLSTSVSHSQADVRMLRIPPTPGMTNLWLIRATGSGGSMSVKDGTEFDMAWLGVHNEWVDHTAKKVFEKTVRDTKGAAVGIPPSSKLEEIIEANPYSAAIAAPDYVIESQRERDGVMCDSILVINGRTKVRWMLGVDDHLPRWRERIIEGNIAAGSMITEISNIVVDNTNPPRMPPEMLHVTVPEGYTEDRVPPPPPPAPPAPTPDKLTRASPDAKPDAKPNPAPTGPPPPPPAPLVLKAPDFDLKDGKGQSVTLASLKGSVVVLEFGGTWCLPLRDAHPELETFTKDYKDLPVKVYMLDVREKVKANAIDDITKGSYSFGLLLDADPIAKSYSIRRYPTYVVIDKEGNINKTEGGFKKVETINAVRDAVNHLTGASIAKQEVPAAPAKPEDKPAPEVKPPATPPKVAPVFKPAPKN
jgi:thiol-disulfide isomerase/thioredoxin